MSHVYATRLTLAEAARMMRGAVKDKSYRATPVGLLVGRYLRWFRNEWGATATTLRDYEAVLARMSLTLADKDPLEVTIEDLREVIDLWADREARTRAKVTSVVRAFWSWAEEHDQVPFSPAAKLRRPRAPRRAAPLLPQNADARLLNAAQRARDRVGLLFLLDLGVRRAELAGIRVADIDLSRRQVTVLGKGQKSRVIPLRGRIVLEIEAYMLEPLPLVDRQPEPRLHPLSRETDGRRTPPGRVPKAAHEPADDPPMVVPARGSGRPRRYWHDERAQHAPGAAHLRDRPTARCGHRCRLTGARLSTTAAIYGHYDLADLERAMDALARSRREREEPAD